MHPKYGCAIGCTRLNTDIPMCRDCREKYGSPFGMSFARYSELVTRVQNRILKPATPNGVKGSVRAAHKNETFKYMRVRDRVGFNAGTPSDLVAVCKSHATPNRDPLMAGYLHPLGWE